VEENVKKHRTTYMDAIIHISENIDIELEDIRKFISPTIRDKLEAEAMNLNFLPRQNTLPVD
tara:strand:- start:1265 stop:1450 length:186 start_codon:yes stop_codon:yes gene_type:complete